MQNQQIKFGTDGWRAIIAREFTVRNVCRVAAGIANYLQEEVEPFVVVGFDTRFGGLLFAESLAVVLVKRGVKVSLDRHSVTTPMVSLATKKLGADLGVMFTASHNPYIYNGLKIKAYYGGPATDDIISEITEMIPARVKLPSDEDYQALKNDPAFSEVNLSTLYFDKLSRRFNLSEITADQDKYVFDAMYGSIQNFIRRLFPSMRMVRIDANPTFHGTLPEPIEKNLEPLRKALAEGDYRLGLAVDGDADRIGLMDGNGAVIDAHHIMLILIWNLAKYNGLKGKVVTGFSSTQKIKALCKYLGLDLEIVKIGFKHSAAIMLKESVMLAGEEAGGIATRGHIPERDGLWNILLILEMLNKQNKTIEAVMAEIEKAVGSFGYSRSDLKLEQRKIDRVINQLKNREPENIGSKKVDYTETLDGFKFYFNDGEWLMIRPSGTEPLLRVYAESTNRQKAEELIALGIRHFELY